MEFTLYSVRDEQDDWRVDFGERAMPQIGDIVFLLSVYDDSMKRKNPQHVATTTVYGFADPDGRSADIAVSGLEVITRITPGGDDRKYYGIVLACKIVRECFWFQVLVLTACGSQSWWFRGQDVYVPTSPESGQTD